jgi:hypothetical protein
LEWRNALLVAKEVLLGWFHVGVVKYDRDLAGELFSEFDLHAPLEIAYTLEELF